ncbi:MAG TPA: transposase [Bryobacteraceae bacterium]
MSRLLQFLGEFGNILQQQLFPTLREELGELSHYHEQFIAVLGLLNIEAVTSAPRRRGRRGHDRVNIARAFVAKAIFRLPTTRALLDRLHCDPVLRRLCGWERAAAIPDETVVSRAFARFAKTGLAQRAHQLLIERTQRARLVGHIVRDSSAIEVREKPQRKSTSATPRPKSRPHTKKERPLEKMTRVERQCSGKMTLEQMLAELPQVCDVGCKNNSHGNKSVWIGYKLHLDVADGHIPISAVLTSASLHDSQAAVPLARMTAQRVINCYDVMDSAYDSFHIRELSRSLQHVPVIEPQRRAANHVPLSPHQRARISERTTIERVFSRLKDEFGARWVRVRGAAKVMTHLMFGLLALTADQILRLGNLNRLSPPVPS